MYKAEILADSINPQGDRLATFALTYPLIIHPEFMTHRMNSRVAASSRAIPIEKMIQRVVDEPFIPESWPVNGKGMQPTGHLSEMDAFRAESVWKRMIVTAVECVRLLEEIGVHKQISNRWLAPANHITVVASSTEWANLFALRVHPDAQEEFRIIATMAARLYVQERDKMARVEYGGWHLPFIFPEDYDFAESREAQLLLPMEGPLTVLKALSAARCARTSYLTHDKRRDPAADIDLYRRLTTARPPHMSPFEHQATPCTCFFDDHTYVEGQELRLPRHVCGCMYPSNYVGWHQFRHEFPNESSTEFMLDGKLYNKSGQLIEVDEDADFEPEHFVEDDRRPEDRD